MGRRNSTLVPLLILLEESVTEKQQFHFRILQSHFSVDLKSTTAVIAISMSNITGFKDLSTKKVISEIKQFLAVRDLIIVHCVDRMRTKGSVMNCS